MTSFDDGRVMSSKRVTILQAVLLAGCYRGADADAAGVGATGDAESGGSEGGEVPGGALCGDEDPSETPLRRLSVLQYENTIRDLLGGDAAVLAELAGYFADLPPDGDADMAFTNMDMRLSQRHINNYYQVADTVATSVTTDDSRLADIAGECATQSAIDDACLEAFVVDFGQRAFRRPLSDGEVEGLLTIVDADKTQQEVVHDLLFVMLMSPQFLYHFETEGRAIDGRDDLLELSPWEIASRLSFHFWQSMPDDELFAAAADGSLATDDGFEAQLDRILADEDGRVREVFARFYRDWYRLDAFGGFAQSAAFEAFAEGEGIGEPGTDHHADMVAEIEALTAWYTWEIEGTVADLVLSDRVFTQSTALARLYAVEPWDGQGMPPAMPPDQRAGVLTRAAFLVTGNEQTAPLHRGAVIRTDILCDDLPRPDPNTLPADALDPPPVDPNMSTRERFEQKTAPGECTLCHQLFNPIGFALEGYDALGRHRGEERIFSDVGELLATIPVDTAAEIVGVTGDPRQVDGPIALMELLVESEKLEPCFARHYFRYTYRRPEADADECVLEELTERLRDDGSIARAVREIAMQPEFRVRRVKG